MIDAFKNPEGKFSGRKFTAFFFSLLMVYVHYKTKPEQLVYIAVIDATLILICLGLVTIPELLKALAIIKQGKTSDDENKPA